MDISLKGVSSARSALRLGISLSRYDMLYEENQIEYFMTGGLRRKEVQNCVGCTFLVVDDACITKVHIHVYPKSDIQTSYSAREPFCDSMPNSANHYICACSPKGIHDLNRPKSLPLCSAHSHHSSDISSYSCTYS